GAGLGAVAHFSGLRTHDSSIPPPSPVVRRPSAALGGGAPRIDRRTVAPVAPGLHAIRAIIPLLASRRHTSRPTVPLGATRLHPGRAIVPSVDPVRSAVAAIAPIVGPLTTRIAPVVPPLVAIVVPPPLPLVALEAHAVGIPVAVARRVEVVAAVVVDHHR